MSTIQANYDSDRTAAQTHYWVVLNHRYLAMTASIVGVLLCVTVAPWSFMKATGDWGQELSFEPSALWVGAVIALGTWAAFLWTWSTFRTANRTVTREQVHVAAGDDRPTESTLFTHEYRPACETLR